MKWLFFAFWLVAAANASAFNTVVIDPGHGGHDPGGIPGQRASEKNLALDVARRLRGVLNRGGMRTVMTRTDDTFISLPLRVFIANRQSNAIFVSIHFNSAKREGAHGFETFYNCRAAARIAARIQARLLRTCGTTNRGVKPQRYYVLRKTRHPAVLAECGFLTNRAEAALCLRADHRQKMAEAIAAAIFASR